MQAVQRLHCEFYHVSIMIGASKNWYIATSWSIDFYLRPWKYRCVLLAIYRQNAFRLSEMKEDLHLALGQCRPGNLLPRCNRETDFSMYQGGLGASSAARILMLGCGQHRYSCQGRKPGGWCCNLSRHSCESVAMVGSLYSLAGNQVVLFYSPLPTCQVQ